MNPTYTKPFIRVLLGILLIKLGIYPTTTLNMTLVVFLAWVILFVLFIARKQFTFFQNPKLFIVIPHLSILCLLAWLGRHEETDDPRKAFIVLGVVIAWFSFYWLLFATLVPEKDKHDEKAKISG